MVRWDSESEYLVFSWKRERERERELVITFPKAALHNACHFHRMEESVNP